MESINNQLYCNLCNCAVQSCKSGRAFRVGLGFGPGLGRVWASLLGKRRAFFGPDTMLSVSRQAADLTILSPRLRKRF